MFNAKQIDKARAHLNRTNRAVAEASAKGDDARALSKRWRRWRVEGSSAGTSKLLSKAGAEKMQAKYGGKIVDVAPPVDRTPEWKKRPCPKCGAKAGKTCKNAVTLLPTSSPHAARKSTAKTEEQAAA